MDVMVDLFLNINEDSDKGKRSLKSALRSSSFCWKYWLSCIKWQHCSVQMDGDNDSSWLGIEYLWHRCKVIVDSVNDWGTT